MGAMRGDLPRANQGTKNHKHLDKYSYIYPDIHGRTDGDQKEEGEEVTEARERNSGRSQGGGERKEEGNRRGRTARGRS